MDKAYDRTPTHRSRELRNNPTDAERRLWRVISNRQLKGIRFNRQVPIGPFICDFVARTPNSSLKSMVVSTRLTQQPTHAALDFCRAAAIESSGFGTMMFWKTSKASWKQLFRR